MRDEDNGESSSTMDDMDVRPSVRRTITLRSNAARQVAINFMPSRQLPYNTIRMKRTSSSHNALVDESDSPDLADTQGDLQGDPDAQADIIVREMEQHRRLMEDDPEAEEMRREALRDLPQGLTMKRHVRAKLSASVSLRSKHRPISMSKRLKYRLGFAVKRCNDRIRDIFFSVELWYEAIRRIEGNFGSAVGSYFYFLRLLFYVNLVLVIMVTAFVVVPQALVDSERNLQIQHLFTSMFNDTLLFYGHYHNGPISPHALTYNMPYAYFFTMACLYLVFFAILCYRTAYSYRHNFIDTAGEARGSGGAGLAGKVFSAWDHGVVSLTAARLHAASIYCELKELLSEQNRKKVKPSFCTKLGQYIANIVITTLVLALIAALQYAFWLLLQVDSMSDYWELLVSAAITVAMSVCPLLFNVVVKLEFYGPRTSFYVTLARTWLLHVGTLVLVFMYCATAGPGCWETRFGQECFRLVTLDAGICLLLLPAVEFVRGFVYKCNPTGSAPEFNITYNSLTIIYNQALLWFGMLFSPLLVSIIALKFLLLFYVKRAVALHACQPATKIWRASQTQTVLYMLVTLSLFTTLFVVGSVFLQSSPACGPFLGFEHVYSVAGEALHLSRQPTVWTVLSFITRPGAVGFLLLLLAVLVYYTHAKASAQRSMVEILRHMLVLQAKDKDFLLAAIAKVSNGEWLYSPKEQDGGPDSHTFRYLKEVRKPSNAGYHFDASRLSHSYLEGRPRSYLKEHRPNSSYVDKSRSNDDGDTDSSFSWKGSNNGLHHIEGGKKWL